MSRSVALAKLFDKAVQGVLDQGCHSKRGMRCVYRGYNGRKCVVGHLLTDEQIAKYLIRPSQLVDSFPNELIKELISNEPTAHAVEFLQDLQYAHDSAVSYKFISSFKAEAKYMADKWGFVSKCNLAPSE